MRTRFLGILMWSIVSVSSLTPDTGFAASAVEVDAANSAGAAVKFMGEFNSNVAYPMTTDGANMSTLGGTERFSPRMVCRSSRNYLKVAYTQDSATGELAVSWDQDLNLDGLYEPGAHGIIPNVSGVCANGFAVCSPGGSWTVAGCQWYKWSADPTSLAITTVPATNFEVSGCRCTNYSCFPASAYATQPDFRAQILNTVGGGVLAAVSNASKKYVLAVDGIDIPNLTITYSARDMSSCEDNTGTTPTPNPARFFNPSSASELEANGQMVVSADSADPDSAYSNLLNTAPSLGKGDFGRCTKTNDVVVSTIPDCPAGGTYDSGPRRCISMPVTYYSAVRISPGDFIVEESLTGYRTPPYGRTRNYPFSGPTGIFSAAGGLNPPAGCYVPSGRNVYSTLNTSDGVWVASLVPPMPVGSGYLCIECPIPGIFGSSSGRCEYTTDQRDHLSETLGEGGCPSGYLYDAGTSLCYSSPCPHGYYNVGAGRCEANRCTEGALTNYDPTTGECFKNGPCAGEPGATLSYKCGPAFGPLGDPTASIYAAAGYGGGTASVSSSGSYTWNASTSGMLSGLFCQASPPSGTYGSINGSGFTVNTDVAAFGFIAIWNGIESYFDYNFRFCADRCTAPAFCPAGYATDGSGVCFSLGSTCPSGGALNHSTGRCEATPRGPCDTFESDPSCRLAGETVDGVVTVLNSNPTGNPVPGRTCKTLSGTGTSYDTSFSRCNLLAYSPPSSGPATYQVCCDFWKVERTFNCSTDNADYNVTSELTRLGKVEDSADISDGNFAYSDPDNPSGSFSDSSFFNVPPDSTGECEQTCKTITRTGVRDSTVVADGGNRGENSDPNVYRYRLKQCRKVGDAFTVSSNWTCPLDADEDLYVPCGCLKTFGEATAAMNFLQEMGKDKVCVNE